jgi:hypothetical protein
MSYNQRHRDKLTSTIKRNTKDRDTIFFSGVFTEPLQRRIRKPCESRVVVYFFFSNLYLVLSIDVCV